MKTDEQILRHAEDYCLEHGIRLTAKRKIVLSGLLKSKQALSAYELVDYCRDEFNQVMPAMSVYRILDFLQENNLAHKLNLANKYVACEHIACDHEHTQAQFLICVMCNKVKEINIGKSFIKELKKSATAAGFHLVCPQLEINCICNNCTQEAPA